MAVINTNVKALFSQMALGASGRAQSVAMQQLSTGKRINSARDDAAGMAIATRMTEQIRSLNQAVRNAGDAISLIQTAEGATNEITDMLQRMRELAVQAATDTNANEQRGYLDLEFQQLKKQIVQISDNTEWNGFPVLNGSAGERVGERPIYKTVSTPQTDTIFISPTTYQKATDGSAAISGVTETDGTDAFTTSPYKLSGVLSVAGDDNGGVTASFLTADNKTITLTGVADATDHTVTFDPDATGADPQLARVFNTKVVYTLGTADPTAATVRLDVQVSGSMSALPAGELVINGVQIPASFAKDDTVSPPNNAAGSAIAKAAAINLKTDQTGVAAVVNQNVMNGVAMNQMGSSAMKGSIVINGVETATFTTSVNNPRETRATIMRAINLISEKTGIQAVDTGADAQGIQLVAKDGRNIEVQMLPADGTDQTTLDNFSDRTGVRPGVQVGTYSLESKVDKNITVSVTNGGSLAASGLRAGTYTNKWVSDEASQLDHPAINTSARALVTDDSSLTGYAAYNAQPKVLKTGDLVINGVPIPGATVDDDTLSGVESTVNTNSLREGSAIATANAINSQFDKTGVRAVANPNISKGSLTDSTIEANSGTMQTLYINGVAIDVPFGGVAGDATQTESGESRAKAVVSAINNAYGRTGVSATVNPEGGVTLNAEKGQNLSVWCDSDKVTAAEFGLAKADGSPISGVSEIAGADAFYDGANVQYGTVSLVSEKLVKIEPGVNGYKLDTSTDSDGVITRKTDISNFTALGFQTGTFGGVVDDASSKMTPPRTGRLSFQVGGNVNQFITIDLADFGKGGPITSDITWDVDMDPVAAGVVPPPLGTDANGNPIQTPQRSYIGSKEAATTVLARLDSVMEKVNATRANMGAVMNRLDHVINNLTNVSMNMSASRSQIEDADYASASTELAKTQIMQQAATAVLAQANTSQQSVMKLLGG